MAAAPAGAGEGAPEVEGAGAEGEVAAVSAGAGAEPEPPRAGAGAARPSEASPFDDVELHAVTVCGLELRVLRRRDDFFAACAGDLPVRSTGVVLWECGVLLAEYLAYARWVGSALGRDSQAEPEAPPPERPWWMLHPPAPVVPARFWSSPARGAVLEVGGGCGLLAAVLASLGARVVCTDGDPAALKTAERNCRDAQIRHQDSRSSWGSVCFRELRWGDAAAARRLAQEVGPIGYVVGSDLLYGEASEPGPLVETLAALTGHGAPGAAGGGGEGGGAAEVILAVKNRCRDEREALCGAARAQGLWEVRLADPEDFPVGFDGVYRSADGEESPAYTVVHLVRRASCGAPPRAAAAPAEAAKAPPRGDLAEAPAQKRPRPEAHPEGGAPAVGA